MSKKDVRALPKASKVTTVDPNANKGVAKKIASSNPAGNSKRR